ncbi:MAG: hypothetical protein NTW80_04475 [Deltaproteobacteria bacterium]|nr:hypothetical protein [Deltaproteobacteria bacterium]
MLLITDYGCELHRRRRLKYSGPEAKVMQGVIANLPGDGVGHTYICEHGHCHRLRVEAQRSEASTAGAQELKTPLGRKSATPG